MLNVMKTEKLIETNGGYYPKWIPCFQHDSKGYLCYLGHDAWREVDCYDPAKCFIDGKKAYYMPKF